MDHGAADCPELYMAAPQCIAEGLATGNNSANCECLMEMATDLANQGLDEAAFGVTLVSQCHNSNQFDNLMAAGPYAVADYLRND
jgi:hypothetical protein